MLTLGQAKANGNTPFSMDFDNGKVNLGVAFKGAEILPGRQAIPGVVSNPAFDPALPVSASNPVTIISETGTPLFSYDALNPAEFSSPGVNGGTPTSFRPLGSGTPVTFGLYAELAIDPVTGDPGTFPDDIILNPVNQSATQPGYVFNPIANSGAPGSDPYYRVRNKGSIVAGTEVNGEQTGLEPTGATLTVASTTGFPDTGTAKVGDDVVTYTGKTAETLTGVDGLPTTVADETPVGLQRSFLNPLAGNAPQTITGPYPAENTVWQPFALNNSFAPAGLTGAPGLRFELNSIYVPNPQNGTASGTVDEEGNVLIQPDDFEMPVMIVPNPLDGSPVPITLESETVTTVDPEANPPTTDIERLPIEGQYDSETGDLTLTGPLSVRVLTGLASNPLGSFCSLSLPNRVEGGGDGPLQLTSGYSLPVSVGFNGTPFQSLEGPGALTGTWNVPAAPPPAVSVGGANCATVNAVSTGLGGIWLGVGVEEPAPYPTCTDLGKVGTFPNCVDPVARLANLKVTGPSKAKRRKPVTLKVTIRNTGNVPVTGVRFSAAGKGVRASSSVGQIAVGGSRTETVKFRARKVGRVKVTFTVGTTNAGKKTATKTVRITR